MSTSDYFLKGSKGQVKGDFAAETMSVAADHESKSIALSINNTSGETGFSVNLPLHDALTLACALMEKVRELEEPKDNGGK